MGKVKVTLALGSSILLGAFLAQEYKRNEQGRMMLETEASEQLAEYLVENRERIEKEVAKRFSVKVYPLKITFMKDFSKYDLGREQKSLMIYWKGEVQVNLSESMSYSALDPRQEKAMDLLSYFRPNPQDTVECAYSHEIGHGVSAVIRGGLREGGKFDETHLPFYKTLEGVVVEEGIGNYFCYDFYGPYPGRLREPKRVEDYIVGEWKEEFETEFKGELRHFSAYSVIKPVMDVCGVKKAITTIYSRPKMSRAELLNPPLYQLRIIGVCKGSN